jgi:hypothetical protein
MIGWFFDVLRVFIECFVVEMGLKNGFFGSKTCKPDFLADIVVADRRHVFYNNKRRVVYLLIVFQKNHLPL